MRERKIIAVAGATGAQGGGLVRAILSDSNGEFAARALTRNPNSDGAKELADLGAEVVEADVGDLESLKRAYDGAYGAFCVTFFWEHFSPEKEKEHAKNMAEAAKAAELKHVIWSTLEDTRKWIPLDDDRMPTLMEKYKVPHFDAKWEANDYFSDLPVTYLLTSFYWDNLIHFGMGPQKNDDGTYSFVLPMGDRKLPGMASEDIGKCAYGIFRRGTDATGRTIGIAGEHLSGAEMAASLSKALGKEVKHVSPPFDAYRGFGFPGAEDLGNMFQFNHDFADEFRAPRDVEQSRQLNPELKTFDQWLEQNGDRIPIE
ncbi:MAG: NmrA/HSCARG family protein [Thermoanaerobaculia bacterium]|nr:NmrA/HSCARG family protein [Thermoanaerobaculia bacterium]